MDESKRANRCLHLSIASQQNIIELLHPSKDWTQYKKNPNKDAGNGLFHYKTSATKKTAKANERKELNIHQEQFESATTRCRRFLPMPQAIGVAESPP
jgi:hypothetical protein